MINNSEKYIKFNKTTIGLLLFVISYLFLIFIISMMEKNKIKIPKKYVFDTSFREVYLEKYTEANILLDTEVYLTFKNGEHIVANSSFADIKIGSSLFFKNIKHKDGFLTYICKEKKEKTCKRIDFFYKNESDVSVPYQGFLKKENKISIPRTSDEI